MLNGYWIHEPFNPWVALPFMRENNVDMCAILCLDIVFVANWCAMSTYFLMLFIFFILCSMMLKYLSSHLSRILATLKFYPANRGPSGVCLSWLLLNCISNCMVTYLTSFFLHNCSYFFEFLGWGALQLNLPRRRSVHLTLLHNTVTRFIWSSSSYLFFLLDNSFLKHPIYSPRFTNLRN